MLVYSMSIWNRYVTAIWHILCPFGNLVGIWSIVPHFGIVYQEKSCNPGSMSKRGKFCNASECPPQVAWKKLYH
jgi:hypothetical protein